MSRYMTATFVVVLIFMMIASLSAGARKPPFNGSIFGKRFMRDMDIDSRATDYRHPVCEYIFDSCSQWFTASQEAQ
ncbi:hypothetical protein X975_04895, partial [Stegodyphus mimosarum]